MNIDPASTRGMFLYMAIGAGLMVAGAAILGLLLLAAHAIFG